jgi:AraC-like DNA-binding protein
VLCQPREREGKIGAVGKGERGGKSNGGTAAAIALRPILAYARTRGVDVEALRLELGVPSSALDDPDFRIPEATHDRAWREAATRSGDSAFALHVVEHSSVGAFDVLDYAMWCSRTLAEAIDRLMSFHRILCDALVLRLEVRAGVARIRFQGGGHGRYSSEVAFALIVVRARESTATSLPPREVKFAHAAPSDLASHASLFRCPVRFGSTGSELVLDARDLALPVRSAQPGLAVVLDRHMREIMSRIPEVGSFIQRVHHAVGETLRASGRPTLSSTAHVLKASSRTVQRRLLEHGTTHREVVDAVRRDFAVRLLEVPGLSITEIAFLLGFSDVSGFTRTFKRWTGRTPALARSRSA